MNIKIEPGLLRGVVQVPPSKSVAHRMLICAALGSGESVLEGISLSEDMLATMDCIRALGALCERRGDAVRIRGIGDRVSREPGRADLPVFACRESGSTLRFLIPIALAVCGGGFFSGSGRLMERGIGIYEEIFRDAGIFVQEWTDPKADRPDVPGLAVRGSLKPGNYRVRGDVSSQFVTGLLFALSLLEGDSTVEVLPPVESRAYIDITVDTMRQFGVMVHETEDNHFLIPGNQLYRARSLTVEGDWSNGAFLYAFQALGHELQIRGLNPQSLQGDKACVAFLDQLKGQKQQDRQRDVKIDISDTPDLGPVLFASAAALGGGHFTGTRRLRIKESDRAAVMREELARFGITCLVRDNDVVVEPGLLKKPEVPLKGHNDHRIVMALSVLASLTGAQIEDAQAVSKSWPEFFEVLQAAGLRIS